MWPRMLTLLVCGLAASTSWAGPNAGGTILVHNAQLPYPGGQGYSACGLGTPPVSCESANTRIDGSDNRYWVWKVYAAFDPSSAPRLKAMDFGIRYGHDVILVDHGPCIGDLGNGSFEEPGYGWPNSGSGTAIVWQYAQTTTLVEAYWFAGYSYYGAVEMFTLTPGIYGGQFSTDGAPPLLDPIAGYGSLGFNQSGSVSCPAAGGACCAPDGTCVLIPQNGCLPPNLWYGGVCDPDPCPQPIGACCTTGGNCSMTTRAQCPPPGVWQGAGTACTPNPCGATGACCQNGSCTVTSDAGCPGQWMGPNSSCDPNPCAQAPTGACCSNGYCTETQETACAAQWLGANTVCCPNPCPEAKSRRAAGARTHGGKFAASIGAGHGISAGHTRVNPCAGTLVLNFDGSAENAYGWQYGGVASPYYGAFAECYNFTGSVCGISLYLTGNGAPCKPLTAYVWSDNGGAPGNVLSVTAGLNPCPVATWPNVAESDFGVFSAQVSGSFWIGYRADFSAQSCGYYIAADLDGPGGCPVTNVACGIGYPTGWQNVSFIWGQTRALGIGVWAGGNPTPVKETTWGRIKSMYH